MAGRSVVASLGMMGDMKTLWRVLSVLLAALAVLLAGAVPASGAVCADYPNQAAAQAAADTRDADGDGKYCETLPCPCATAGGGGGGSAPAPAPRPKPKPKRVAPRRVLAFDARITRVVDGDTVNVRAFGAPKAYYKIRLIGIDTPETKKSGTPVECGGLAATSSMLAMAFSEPADMDEDGLFDTGGGEGAKVSVKTDASQGRTDRYGRLLAYVTARDGGVNLARRQVADGWSRVYVYGGRPFAQVASFRDAQESAEDERRGVWGECDGNFHTPE